MIPVNNRKQQTLIPIIKKWIKPRSIIHSNCWKAYSNLSKMGYTHVTVNHSKQLKNHSNLACTNCIESEWRHAHTCDAAQSILCLPAVHSGRACRLRNYPANRPEGYGERNRSGRPCLKYLFKVLLHSFNVH